MFSDDGVLDRNAVRASLDFEVAATGETTNPSPSTLTYQDIVESGADAFWHKVQKPYRERSLTREELRQIIAEALEATRGSYKRAALNMGIEEKDYRRFLDFLKNSDAKLDFRDFR
jgi:hypothetical protein